MGVTARGGSSPLGRIEGARDRRGPRGTLLEGPRGLAGLATMRGALRTRTSGTHWDMSRPTVAMIGVYGASLETFLAALRRADVTVLLDVRQRRGVRGREYAWANSLRLQAALAAASIDYRHHVELAPTTELREAAVPRGRTARRGQAQSQRARARVSPSLRPGDPRSRRHGRLRGRASAHGHRRVAVRRARRTRLSSVADRRAAGSRPRCAHRRASALRPRGDSPREHLRPPERTVGETRCASA